MTLSQKDQEYLWHPYTQHKTEKEFPVIVKGKGALLWDETGKEYIDAIASWWVNPFGHANKTLAQAIYKQLNTLEHVLFGGFTHQPAIQLAEKLLEILPNNQKKIFFSDNGSTAVEIAIKVALQYFYNKNQKKTTLIAFEDAFHGDTFAAMAASGISMFTEAFKKMFIDVVRLPVPTPGNEQKTIKALEKAIKKDTIAAFIYEPLVQGAAGMIMYSPEVLNELLRICKKNNVLTIADEVMTGFGKTGKNFASNYHQNQPDMMCLSKALTGGTLPMAITTFSQSIYEVFYDDDKAKALFHGHTYTGNPTGCAAAIASLEILKTDKIQKGIAQINKSHEQFQKKLKKHPKVATTRILGTIFALEIKAENKESYYGTMRNKLYNFFIQNGVILRPIGNIIYVMPPYIITKTQLKKIYNTIEQALEIV
jgi:adenosylmethionine---8-amino-7-oxononanoate aminotransferase